MLRRFTALLSIAACAASAQADNPETLAERSQATARAVLERAANTLGGVDELRSIVAIRVQLEGEDLERLQLPTPEPPFEPGTKQEMVLLDVKNNRLRFDQRLDIAGFQIHNTSVIQGGEGTVYNHRAQTLRPFSSTSAIERELATHHRRLPHLLLRQALERAGTLRSLGQDTFEGKLHDVFTFVTTDAQQVTLYVETASALVSKYELLIVDPLTGDEASEVIFSDYVRTGKTQVPQSLRAQEAGEATLRARLKVEINPALTDQAFEVAAERYVRVNPSRESFPQGIEKLAEGVFVIQNVAGRNQNTLAVAFKDYIVAVEAPGSSAGTEQVIARIKETIPGKPIRYIAVTHHHGDHIGGLRSFIAEGTTVITTPGNRKIVERLAAAPQNDRLASHPRAPQIELIERGKRVLSDGSRTLELIDIGPHPHAREMVIAYLPRERIVFQADLFIIPSNEAPAGPPVESFAGFAKKLKELRLRVDRIASVHGRTATIDEFLQRMSQGEPGS
jgi:glyoxylase-like metal-dependent hydrolase (beta-lactamase superfamily II)